jgi:hypothetical protein
VAEYLTLRFRFDAPRSAIINPSAPFLLPLLEVVATALLSGLFVDQLDYFYPLRVVVGLLVLASWLTP